jgi:hypothetical protein
MAGPDIKQIKVDAAGLYREETYTDLKTGHIRKLVPVRIDGGEDPTRPAVFTASTQVMTPAGVLPLNGEIEQATTLAQAVEKFPEAIEQALQHLREEMEAMRREEASRIVVPGRDMQAPPNLKI